MTTLQCNDMHTCGGEEASFAAAEEDGSRRESALQVISFAVGGRTLRLLADPTNAWGRSGGRLQHCNTGNRLWPSAATLAEFLLTLPAAAPSPALTCIELGAGLGAVGMALAARGGARVLLTDQPQMLPLLRRNVDECFGDRGATATAAAAVDSVPPRRGQWACPAAHVRPGGSIDGVVASAPSGAAPGSAVVWVPEVRALCWGGGFKDTATGDIGINSGDSGDDDDDDDDDADDDDDDDAGTALLPTRYQLVVGSDLCYDDEAFAKLRATIDAVASPGATCVLAVHDRPAAHAFFLSPWPRWSWQLGACVDHGKLDPVSGKSRVMVYVGRSEAAAAAVAARTTTTTAAAAAAAESTGDYPGGGSSFDDADAAACFALGEVVEAHSLTSAASLNGQRGVVVRTALGELNGNRVGVSFAPPLGRKAVKASNLRRVVATGAVVGGGDAAAVSASTKLEEPVADVKEPRAGAEELLGDRAAVALAASMAESVASAVDADDAEGRAAASAVSSFAHAMAELDGLLGEDSESEPGSGSPGYSSRPQLSPEEC